MIKHIKKQSRQALDSWRVLVLQNTKCCVYLLMRTYRIIFLLYFNSFNLNLIIFLSEIKLFGLYQKFGFINYSLDRRYYGIYLKNNSVSTTTKILIHQGNIKLLNSVSKADCELEEEEEMEVFIILIYFVWDGFFPFHFIFLLRVGYWYWLVLFLFVYTITAFV